MKKVAFLVLMTANALSFTAKGQVVINEIMQSNIDAYFCNWEYPDSWVEIYNPTDRSVNMTSWAIGTNANFASAYPLAFTIAPKGYFIIACDNTGRTNCPDFRLESDSKGKLYLFDKSGNIVDHITYPIMAAPNIAYGRITDGSDEWGWEKKATPACPNEGGHSGIVLPAPEFSIDGCLMKDKETATVTITMPTWTTLPEDTRIYVTFDGSEPTVESVSGTELEFDITQTTILRAKLISSKALSPRSVAQSYIYHPRETTFPVISVVGDDRDLYDSIIGMYSAKKNYSNLENFRHNWRRPVNIEYLNSDEIHFTQTGEACIAGGASRIAAHPQKSLKLYAHKRFGKKNFKGRLWSDKPDVKKVKSFTMRNGGNTSRTYRITDAMVHKLFGKNVDNLDWQAYEPALMYINGVYKGVFGLRERSNDHYVEANHGLDDNDIEMAETYKDTNSAFAKFRRNYQRGDVTYEELDSQMDIDNFMKAMITECYSSNTDYPHNNLSMWRPSAEGGKWRWILKDLDYMQYGQRASFNMFNYMLLTGKEGKITMEQYPVKVSSHFLYQKMMTFPEFKERFIDLYAVYLGDFLQKENVLPLIDRMADEIDTEVGETWKIYSISDDPAMFKTYIGKLKGYCADRPKYVYQQMSDYFSLGTVIPMQIDCGGRAIKVNGTTLTQDIFRGAWFGDRTLTLTADTNGMAWLMTVTHADSAKTTYTLGSNNVTIRLSDYADCSAVEFNLAVPEAELDAVNSLADNNSHTEPAASYNLQGQRTNAEATGIVISNGNKYLKK